MSERIASRLIELHIVDEEDREIYVFGIREFFSLICSFSMTLLVGILMNMVLEAIVFTCAYLPVRIYAGGYHAPTQMRCYVLSLGMVLTALLVIGHVAVPEYVSMMIIVVSSILIYALSPSEHKNKPLSEKERRVYKKKVGKILIMFNVISFFILIMAYGKILFCITLALLFLIGMMVLSHD